MRQVDLQSDKLKKILEDRDIVFKDIQKINEQLQELDAKRNQLALKMDRLKDKTKKIMDDNPIATEEFEVITRVFLDNGLPKAEIVDEVEEFKKYKRQLNAESK